MCMLSHTTTNICVSECLGESRAKPNEKHYLLHMRSRSLNDSKVWMMTKYQSKQSKAPNPYEIHRLDCCKYHLSAMKCMRGLTMAPRAAQMGPFSLSNNLLGKPLLG